jgi:hypothetical protein
MATIEDLSNADRNTDIPFFPNLSWNLTSSDFGNKGLATFNYIQAFFDNTLDEIPYICVYAGDRDDGTPILSQVRFAYSGEKVQIKGKGIFESGTNIRGQAVSSTPIGDSPTTDLSEVIAYGGMR